jgi:hypothetical protein
MTMSRWVVIATCGLVAARGARAECKHGKSGSTVAIHAGAKLVAGYRQQRLEAEWTGRYLVIWEWTKTANIYDACEDTWRQVSPPTTTSNIASHRLVKDKLVLLLFGNDVAELDLATGTWIDPPDADATAAIVPPPAQLAWGPGDRLDRVDVIVGNKTTTHASLANPPSPRNGQVQVVDGTRVLVWGGWHAPTTLADGAVLDLATDTWRAMATASAPSARAGAASAWTGHRLAIWAGVANKAQASGGAIYDSAADRWAAMTGAIPSPRAGWIQVVDGDLVYVIGGYKVPLAARGEPAPGWRRPRYPLRRVDGARAATPDLGPRQRHDDRPVARGPRHRDLRPVGHAVLRSEDEARVVRGSAAALAVPDRVDRGRQHDPLGQDRDRGRRVVLRPASGAPGLRSRAGADPLHRRR